jgi:hypothetical protein
MKKVVKILSFLFLLLTISTTFAQSVDVNNYRFENSGCIMQVKDLNGNLLDSDSVQTCSSFHNFQVIFLEQDMYFIGVYYYDSSLNRYRNNIYRWNGTTLTELYDYNNPQSSSLSTPYIHIDDDASYFYF